MAGFKDKRFKFKSLKEYRTTDPSDLSYIPVLDKNPKLAVQYLTKEDLLASYELLKEVFNEIKSKTRGIKHKIMVDTLLFSKENFKWYSVFLRHAANLLNLKEVRIPYDKSPKYSMSSHPTRKEVWLIRAHQPFGVYYDGQKKNYFAEELEQNRAECDAITNFRIKYISEQHEVQEFVGKGYPTWYTLEDLTIYEKYCVKTNTRIRVDFKNGKLHYFIAGASDNWKEIKGVPDDMKYVIYALLFRNSDVNTLENAED